AVAAVVGPVGGGSHSTAAEAEALFAEAPALSGLSYEDLLGLSTAAVPLALAPGANLTLNGPDEALLLISGVIAMPDGQELGRGTLIGPAGVDHPGTVAVARTPVRVFVLPAVSGLPLLLGATPRAVADSEARLPGRAPVFGVHPPVAYPPLAGPPGP